MENKYETIGKSLDPYKIDNKNKESPTRGSNNNLLQALPETPAEQEATNSYQSGLSKNLAISPTFSASVASSSSHYAHISPLKGTELPLANSSYFNVSYKGY